MSEHCHLESCRDRGSQPGKACRVEVELIGAGAGSADEGLDVNVHGFALSPTSLNLAPTRFRGALPYLEERGQERGRPRQEQNWSPRLFYLLHRSFSHSHELGVMREKQTLVR